MAQLDELKAELANLRVAKVSGGPASKLAKIKVVRKAIARVLTVYNQTQKVRHWAFARYHKAHFIMFVPVSDSISDTLCGSQDVDIQTSLYGLRGRADVPTCYLPSNHGDY